MVRPDALAVGVREVPSHIKLGAPTLRRLNKATYPFCAKMMVMREPWGPST